MEKWTRVLTATGVKMEKGGLSRRLCLDNYGKALSAAVLEHEIEVPDGLKGKFRGMQ